MLLVKDILGMAIKQLEDKGVPDARHDAEALFCYLMKIPRDKFFRWWSDQVDDRTIDQYMELVAVRASRVPLQHITGTQNFMGFDLDVDKEVLIPRQDTESVAKKGADLVSPVKNPEVLDLCCGSGNIGIAIAMLRGAKVTFIDADEKACALTRKNAGKHGVKATVFEGDLFEPLRKGKFDLIISNPPYIKTGDLDDLMPEVKDNEPLSALDGGADGLDIYRRIVEKAPEHLKEGAFLVLEIGHDQARDVCRLIEETEKFMDIETGQDLAGRDRVVSAMLISRKIQKQRAKEKAREEARQAKENAKQAKIDEKKAREQAKEDARKAKEEAKAQRKKDKKKTKTDADGEEKGRQEQ